jgi:transposase InsO family protein
MKDMIHNTQILIATERERWLNLHLKGGLTVKELSNRSGFSRDTLHRWKREYLRCGLDGLKEKSRAHRWHPKTTLHEIVARIREIRQETRFCSAKIKLRLEKEGIRMSSRGVHRVLKREGLVRTKKRIPRKDIWIPRSSVPGEVVEVDVAFMRKFRGNWLYQFTAIDSCTRWRYLWTTPEQSNRTSVIFLERLIKKAPFAIKGIKTDNGSIFTNRYTGYAKSADPLRPKLHVFDRICRKHGIVHYLIDPGKPQQNGKVERSHRTDREEFWNRIKFNSLSELKRKQSVYANWYNNEREHLGIGGKTPMELLKSVRYDLA